MPGCSDSTVNVGYCPLAAFSVYLRTGNRPGAFFCVCIINLCLYHQFLRMRLTRGKCVRGEEYGNDIPAMSKMQVW